MYAYQHWAGTVGRFGIGETNIPSELLANEGEATTTVLTAICQKIWETKGWPKEWIQSLIIPFTKEKRPEAMTNSTNNISADISMKGQKLEEVISFKYLEQSCAKMALAEQKSAPGLPQ